MKSSNKKSGKTKPPKGRKKSFGEKEFVKSLWKTMRGQAAAQPAIGLLHERLEGTVKLIGLTGGIASGKSTVAQLFKKVGLPVIDADEIAREVVRPKKKALREIVATFGEGILMPDGTLDREKMASIIFGDPSKRSLLESITHPEILRELVRRVTALKKKKERLIVIDVPLLFESGLHRQMDRNVLVRLDPEVQLRRLTARDRLPEIVAWQRILSQMPTAEKERLAHFVIDNSGSLEETGRQVATLLPKLQGR